MDRWTGACHADASSRELEPQFKAQLLVPLYTNAANS